MIIEIHVYGLIHKILLFMAHVLSHSSNMQPQLSSENGCLKFSLCLHLRPASVCASKAVTRLHICEGSPETFFGLLLIFVAV